MEKICEYNINQLEEVDSAFAQIVAVYDRTYVQSRDSSVRIYDIRQDIDRTNIISNSISIGERDMGSADVLDEFLSKYLGDKNILIIKPHSNSITIGKNVVTDFIEIVSKKDARYNGATISALDLDSLDITFFKQISDELLKGISNPEARNRYLTAIKNTLESAMRFQPLGRNRILTHYDIEDFLHNLEHNLNTDFDKPDSSVIQSYSNSYVKKASGLSILFFKDLSMVSSVRKKDLID